MADGDPENKNSDIELVKMATEATNTMFASGAVEKGKGFDEVFRGVYSTIKLAASGQLDGVPEPGTLSQAAAQVREDTKELGARHPERDGPAVPIKKSVTPTHIVCLEDGKKLKMLTRHLSSKYNMSPDQYKTKWGLPADYPMIAPESSKIRSQLAKDRELGKSDHKRTGPKGGARKKA